MVANTPPGTEPLEAASSIRQGWLCTDAEPGSACFVESGRVRRILMSLRSRSLGHRTTPGDRQAALRR